MSEDKREQLSAMMDGELEAADAGIVDTLVNSDNLRSSWSRYHMISDCLQQQLPEAVDKDLAQKISDSIESEPHILAPSTTTRSSFLRPVAGFAIAASVATIAILGIQQGNENAAVTSGTTIAANTGNTPQLVSQPVANTVDENQLRQVKNDARARMNSYLVNYSEYRTNAGLQGMLPYARTVTYEENK